MKSAYDEAVRLLPSKTAAALGERFKAAEEFRLRAGRYPSALIGGREEVIADKAVTRDDIACVLEKATNASLHAVWQDMSKGFISCGFGLRIGVCGTGVISSGKLTGLRDISSVSIRIPKQATNCGGEVLKKLCDAKDNVLIISPPDGGKTTFLRECIRAISSSGVRVAVCDERGELAAVFRGVPREYDEDPEKIEDISKIGYGGVLCIETGGPTPGLGCAGRGIIATFSLLEDLELFETYEPDVVLYDVLGDVVCGGFAAPIREGYASKVLIVTSGEKMALYAANNINNAVKNFEDRSYAKVYGIVLNHRNVENETEKVTEFATSAGLPIVGEVPRSDEITRCVLHIQ